MVRIDSISVGVFVDFLMCAHVQCSGLVCLLYGHVFMTVVYSEDVIGNQVARLFDY